MRVRLRAVVAAFLAVTWTANVSIGGAAATSANRHPAQVIAQSHALPNAPKTKPPLRVAVPEPPKRRPIAKPPADSFRPVVSRDVHIAQGIPGLAPPMLRPAAMDRVLAAARHHVATSESATRGLRVMTQPPGARTSGARMPGAGIAGSVRRTQTLSTTSAGAGSKPWWPYRRSDVPGSGHAAVNVATGNMLLRDDDMNIAHKGVALSFTRTYNSQSAHDVSGDDGWSPGLYGNGWTNTFDAHITGSLASGAMTVYDGEGGRYDYTLSADHTTWLPPPGQHATLVWDGSGGMMWTTKSGITYYFTRPDVEGPVPSWLPSYPIYANWAGYDGRLDWIFGRNRNTYLELNYSWDNGYYGAGGKPSAISVQTESGMVATLTFGDVSGHRLLQQLTLPDGVTAVYYGYDASGNLTVVNRPPNNASGTRALQAFGYQAIGADQVMYYVASPRWYAACLAGACVGDGGVLVFYYSGTSAAASAVSTVQHEAVVNPSIPDGTGSSYLQPGYPTTASVYSTEYYTTGGTSPTYRDTDGHAINWIVDGAGRQTQIQIATAAGQGGTSYLVSNQAWDANNDLVATVDPGGHEADFAYDASGNVVAVGKPAVSNPVASGAAYQPTSLYDYDAFNNVVAYCDETEVHPGGDWYLGEYSSGSDSYCTSLAGAASHHATYTYPSYEPYGELSSVTTPSGYTRTVTYDTVPQGGADYGLPTSISGASINQYDLSVRQVGSSRSYDANGNVVCSRADSSSAAASVMSYDVLDRLVAVADPDDASMSSCSKTPGIAGSTITTRLSYYADGSVATLQTPSELAGGGGTTFTYDLDGNPSTMARYHTSPQNADSPVRKRWYDGADRLIETLEPADPATSGDFPIALRYLYDLSQNGSAATISGTSVTAHGNRYDIEKNTPTGWIDFKYSAFDLADRVTVDYAFAPCAAVGDGSAPPYGAVYCSQPAFATRYSWDASSPGSSYGGPGLLASVADGLGQTKNYVYDGGDSARVIIVVYGGDNGSTTQVSYQYGPSGLVTKAANVDIVNGNPSPGTGTAFDYSYSADGDLAQIANAGLQSTTTYNRYRDGALSGVASVASPLVNQPNLYQYAYRNDGMLAREGFGPSNQSVSFSYTPGGRRTGMTDFASGPSIVQQYDAHGLLSSVTTPAGTYGSMTYDLEGRLLQYSAFNGEAVSSQYDVRGDLIGRRYQPNVINGDTGNGSYPGFQYRNVQGVLVQNATDQYDGRTGAPLIVGGTKFTYDAIGRITSSGAAVYSYDAENRMTAGDTMYIAFAGDYNCATGGVESEAPAVVELTYKYDGEGQMYQDTSRSGTSPVATRQWLWNGGQVLYTGRAAYGGGFASIDGYEADGLGIITTGRGAPGLTISDFDFDGVIAQRHNSTGHSAWQASNSFHQECISANPLPASAGYVDPFGAGTTPPADDSTSDPGVAINSAGRAYVSRANGYTTPDYASATPYASSRRGTRDYCLKNPLTGHIDLIRTNGGLDACSQNKNSNTFESIGPTDAFGFGWRQPGASAAGSKRPEPKPKRACLASDYLAISLSKGSLDMTLGPGASVGMTFSKEGTITPNVWLGVGVGAGPTIVVGDVAKPVGGSIDDFPSVVSSSGAFAGPGRSISWAGPNQYADEIGAGFPQAFTGLQYSAPFLSSHSQRVADWFCK